MRVFLNFEARLCHAGGVGERKVGLGAIGLGGHYFNLARLALRVVEQGCFFGNLDHIYNIVWIVFAWQNYVFFGTGAFSYRIKYGVSAMFKIYLVFFYTLMWTVPIGKVKQTGDTALWDI